MCEHVCVSMCTCVGVIVRPRTSVLRKGTSNVAHGMHQRARVHVRACIRARVHVRACIRARMACVH